MPDRPEDPSSWGQLVRQSWPHYCAIVLLLLGLAASDRIPPQQHAVYSASDRQWWTYARPILPERLPDVDMPLLAVALPLAVLWAASVAKSISRHEAHNMTLALLACLATAGLVTNLLKTQVRGYVGTCAIAYVQSTKAPQLSCVCHPSWPAGCPPPTRLCAALLAKVARPHICPAAQRPSSV